MTSPISSKLSALQAYNRPEKKPVENRPDQQGSEKTTQSRRMSPALTVQLSVEAQKILSTGGTPQKVAAVQESLPVAKIENVQKYENGVGRREAPLTEPSVQSTMRAARMGSVLDIKV